MEYNQFASLLLECNSGVADQMRQAQSQLENFKQSNPDKFYVNCILAVTNTTGDLPMQARQMSALIFKNSIKETIKRSQTEGQEVLQQQGWLTIDENVRSQIKDGLMQLLGNEDEQCVKNASQCLAIVAVCEVPLGLWDVFVNQMVSVATNSQENAAAQIYAAMMTLGLVSEDLEDTPMSSEMVHQILYACVSNISQKGELLKITRIAAATLMRTMAQTKGCYDTEDRVQYIIEQGIFAAMNVSDFETQISAYNSLLELPNVAPLSITCRYIPQIGQQTGNVLQSGNVTEETARCMKALLTFWIVLSQEIEKKDPTLNDFNQSIGGLFQITFQAIQLHQMEEDDTDLVEGDEMEEQETVAQVALELLTELVKRNCQMSSLDMWENIQQTYMQFLQGQSWLEHYCGIQTLQATLKGVSQANNSLPITNQLVVPKIKDIFGNFFSFFSPGSNEKIRFATCKLIETVCQTESAVMILQDQDLYKKVYETGKILLDSQTEKPKVKVSMAQAWSGLYCMSKMLETKVHIQKPHNLQIDLFAQILSTLHDLTTNTQIIASNSLGFICECIADICQNCQSTQLQQTLFQFLQSVLNSIASMIQSDGNSQQIFMQLGLQGDEQLEVFLSHYASMVQPLMYSLGQDDQNLVLRNQTESNVSLELVINMLDLVFTIFSRFQKVSTGGLFIVHGLLAGGFLTKLIGENTSDELNNRFNSLISYLTTAMREPDRTDDLGTRMSCGFISDFCSDIPQVVIQNQQNLETMVQSCLSVLSNNDVETQAKLHAVIALGDLYMAAEGKRSNENSGFITSMNNNQQSETSVAQDTFMKYLQQTLQCFQGAAQASLAQAPESLDEEEAKIIVSLREALIEGYISVLHGLESLNNQQQSFDFKTQIINYLEALCNNTNANASDSADPNTVSQGANHTMSSEMLGNVVDLYCDLFYLMQNTQETCGYLTQHVDLFQIINQRLHNVDTSIGEIEWKHSIEEKKENLNRVGQILQDQFRQGPGNGGSANGAYGLGVAAMPPQSMMMN